MRGSWSWINHWVPSNRLHFACFLFFPTVPEGHECNRSWCKHRDLGRKITARLLFGSLHLSLSVFLFFISTGARVFTRAFSFSWRSVISFFFNLLRPTTLLDVCFFECASASQLLKTRYSCSRCHSIKSIFTHLSILRWCYISPGTVLCGHGVMRSFSVSVQREGYSKYCSANKEQLCHCECRDHMF